MAGRPTVEIECIITKLTPDAVLIDTGTDQAWIPLQYVEESGSLVEDDTTTITVPEWIAEDRGLI